jgi:hypothetical protein
VAFYGQNRGSQTPKKAQKGIARRTLLKMVMASNALNLSINLSLNGTFFGKAKRYGVSVARCLAARPG